MAGVPINKKTVCLIWVLIWLPVSFLFPSHHHFVLGGVIAPITALILPLDGSFLKTFNFTWQYVYFPAVVFWGVLILLMVVTSLWGKRVKGIGGAKR